MFCSPLKLFENGTYHCRVCAKCIVKDLRYTLVISKALGTTGLKIRYNILASHPLHSCFTRACCHLQHACQRKRIHIILLYRLTEQSTTLIFCVGCLRVPYRFAHFLLADRPWPAVRAFVNRAMRSWKWTRNIQAQTFSFSIQIQCKSIRLLQFLK